MNQSIINISTNFLDFVKPICLPFDDNAKEDYRKHQNGTDIVTHVAGWGATDPRGNHHFCNTLRYFENHLMLIEKDL